MRIGLGPLAHRAADVALAAARAKKGAHETRRRIAAAITPLLEQAALIGADQALIAAREHPDAVLAIEARKRALLDDP